MRVPHQLGAHQPGSHRHEAVGRFSEHKLRGLAVPELEVPRREVIPGGVAEDVTEGVGLAHLLDRLADDDLQLDLVVELGGYLRGELHLPPMSGKGVVVLVEEDRRLGDGRARLLRVSLVVEAQHEDFLGRGNARSKLGGALRDEGSLQGIRRCEDGLQTLHISPGDDVVRRCRDSQPQQLPGLSHVEDALALLHTKARAGWGLQHAIRQGTGGHCWFRLCSSHRSPPGKEGRRGGRAGRLQKLSSRRGHSAVSLVGQRARVAQRLLLRAAILRSHSLHPAIETRRVRDQPCTAAGGRELQSPSPRAPGRRGHALPHTSSGRSGLGTVTHRASRNTPAMTV